MAKQGSGLPRAAIVAVAAAAFSLSMLSIARADQPVEQTHAAKTHPKKHVAKIRRMQPGIAPGGLFGSAPNWQAKRCAWPYQNQFPPCLSTWPEGDPNYHGSRPGPTFDSPF
jgi:hypothetical protein